ncbi:RCC1/BLIP-II [Amylocystis lapponica]|nr:RCC1/BLIP-II [Amylocystis lapponica]
MPVLTDLPVELFLDNILPLLPLRDLLSLSSTNNFFVELASDETFWHRKIQQDFNFPSAETARSTGWQFLYKRLYNPQVYVWGEATNGRLGVRLDQHTRVSNGLPYPVRLQIREYALCILSLRECKYHTSHVVPRPRFQGDIYVWGTLDGNGIALQSDGFSERMKKADRPMRLKLLVKFHSISCGRLHCSALDTTSEVWTFTSWGRPFVIHSPLLDKSSPETTPVQIECGWAFSSVLTQSGDVLVFWPFSGQINARIAAKDEELDQSHSPAAKAKVDRDDPNVIPCYSWTIDDIDPARLPPIPASRLPDLPGTGLSEESSGHVLKYGMLAGEDSYEHGSWEFLDEFSDITKVRDHPTFAPPTTSDSTDAGERPEPPTTMHITHISAQFQTFVAYSTGERSVVLMGKLGHVDAPVPGPPHPTILPALQNRGVIAVVLGDYHYGALTADGRLLTWGAFSHGALGLGDPARISVGNPGGFADQRLWDAAQRGSYLTPPEVRVPAEVPSGGRKRFCFAAAAAGWHMGALVIDLERDGEEEAEAEDMPGAFPEQPDVPPMPHAPGVVPMLPFGNGRGLFPFRVGFAGRGRGIGGGPPGGRGGA